MGRAFTACDRMQAVPGGPVRLFVAPEHAHRRQTLALIGPADLAVEVVSEDSVAGDRAEKFDEYEPAGVREYCVVHIRPGHERGDFRPLDEEGAKHRAVPIGDDGVYRTIVLPGLWSRVSWLRPNGMQDALPPFAEMVGGPSGLVAALRHSQAPH